MPPSTFQAPGALPGVGNSVSVNPSQLRVQILQTLATLPTLPLPGSGPGAQGSGQYGSNYNALNSQIARNATTMAAAAQAMGRAPPGMRSSGAPLPAYGYGYMASMNPALNPGGPGMGNSAANMSLTWNGNQGVRSNEELTRILKDIRVASIAEDRTLKRMLSIEESAAAHSRTMGSHFPMLGRRGYALANPQAAYGPPPPPTGFWGGFNGFQPWRGGGGGGAVPPGGGAGGGGGGTPGGGGGFGGGFFGGFLGAGGTGGLGRRLLGTAFGSYEALRAPLHVGDFVKQLYTGSSPYTNLREQFANQSRLAASVGGVGGDMRKFSELAFLPARGLQTDWMRRTGTTPQLAADIIDRVGGMRPGQSQGMVYGLRNLRLGAGFAMAPEGSVEGLANQGMKYGIGPMGSPSEYPRAFAQFMAQGQAGGADPKDLLASINAGIENISKEGIKLDLTSTQGWADFLSKTLSVNMPTAQSGRMGADIMSGLAGTTGNPLQDNFKAFVTNRALRSINWNNDASVKGGTGRGIQDIMDNGSDADKLALKMLQQNPNSPFAVQFGGQLLNSPQGLHTVIGASNVFPGMHGAVGEAARATAVGAYLGGDWRRGLGAIAADRAGKPGLIAGAEGPAEGTVDTQSYEQRVSAFTEALRGAKADFGLLGSNVDRVTTLFGRLGDTMERFVGSAPGPSHSFLDMLNPFKSITVGEGGKGGGASSSEGGIGSSIWGGFKSIFGMGSAHAATMGGFGGGRVGGSGGSGGRVGGSGGGGASLGMLPQGGNVSGSIPQQIYATMKARGASDAFIQGAMAVTFGEGGMSEAWKQSGARRPDGSREESFGPWQLYKGGELPNYLKRGGKVGNIPDQSNYVVDRLEQLVPGITKSNNPGAVVQAFHDRFKDYGASSSNLGKGAVALNAAKSGSLPSGSAGYPFPVLNTGARRSMFPDLPSNTTNWGPSDGPGYPHSPTVIDTSRIPEARGGTPNWAKNFRGAPDAGGAKVTVGQMTIGDDPGGASGGGSGSGGLFGGVDVHDALGLFSRVIKETAEHLHDLGHGAQNAKAGMGGNQSGPNKPTQIQAHATASSYP